MNSHYKLDFTIPQGPTGPTGSLSTAYSGLYSTQNNNYTLTKSTKQVIQLTGNMLTSNVTVDNTDYSLTIKDAGNYLVIYYAFVSLIYTEYAFITISINDITSLSSNKDMGSSNDKNESQDFFGCAITSFNAGDKIQLKITLNGADTADVSIKEGTKFCIIKL